MVETQIIQASSRCFDSGKIDINVFSDFDRILGVCLLENPTRDTKIKIGRKKI